MPGAGVLVVDVGLEPLPPHPVAASRIVAEATRRSCSDQRRRRRPKSAVPRSPNGSVAANSMRWRRRACEMVVVLVIRVRVVVAGVVAVGVRLVAPVVMVVKVGFPVAVSRTDWPKPPMDVIVIVDVAVELRGTVAVAGERVMEKSDAGAAVIRSGIEPEVEGAKVVAPP